MPTDIAIDFGESSVAAAARGWTEPVAEPSAAAYRAGRLISMGEEALGLYGRAPREVRVKFPVREGRMADGGAVGEWVRAICARHAPNTRVRKVNLLFTLTGLGGEGMRQALKEAALSCDAGECRSLPRELAIWAGLGEDIWDPAAGILAWAGEGYTSAALIARGNILALHYAPGGLSEVDKSIAETLRREYSLAVGPATAKELRTQLAAAKELPGVRAPAVGLNLASGFPVAREIPASVGLSCAKSYCEALCECVRRAAAQAAPEAARDLTERPVRLAGPGANLPGLKARLTERTGLTCEIKPGDAGRGLTRFLAEEPLSAFTSAL